jgi:phospholipid/cholesterol/gamma-HCH transport system substrate-binding protein
VITGSNDTFEALASEERALADTFKIFPTFQRETRFTLERLDAFQANTRPLVRDLIPVARDISPTLRHVRRLSPPLRSLFVDLDKLVKVSKRGLPALRGFLEGLGPVLEALDPFLANLNPVVRYLGYYRATITNFLDGIADAMGAVLPEIPGQPAARHALRSLSPTSAESLAIYPERLATNRGNGYLSPTGLRSFFAMRNGIFENFDCKNTDFGPGSTDPDEDPVTNDPPEQGFANCIIAPGFPSVFGGGRAPRLFSDP